MKPLKFSSEYLECSFDNPAKFFSKKSKKFFWSKSENIDEKIKFFKNIYFPQNAALDVKCSSGNSAEKFSPKVQKSESEKGKTPIISHINCFPQKVPLEETVIFGLKNVFILLKYLTKLLGEKYATASLPFRLG